MKKLEQKTTPEQTGKETAQPTLSIVKTNDTNTVQPDADTQSVQPPAGKIETPISIEKRLQAVETLYQKKETLERYRAKYQEHLQFEFDLNEGADIESESFATCSLKFTDSKGRTLTVKSGAYLRECHEICKAKYKAIIEQLEEEIRWPYSAAA